MSRSSVAALVAAVSTLTPAAAWAASTTAQPTLPTSLSAPTTGASGAHAPLAKATRVKGERLAERTRRTIDRRAAARAAARNGPSSDPRLVAIRTCESHGNYATNTGNGFYGAYQFDLGTWRSVGGSGLPSDAPPAEQDRRATMLLQRSGASPWPVCGA